MTYLRTTGRKWPDAFIIVGLALITALPPTIMAFAALRQGQSNSIKGDQSVAQGQALIEKTEQIHMLTNSNLTAIKAELARAKMQIEELQELVMKLSEKKHEKAR